MKLYYSPGACSLSPHIVICELGLSVEMIEVNLKNHVIEGGGDFYAASPLGYVPLLELDSGEWLHEGPAIVQYLADLVPAAGLAPANGTIERYRLQQWLNFLSTEIHKGIVPVFYSAVAGRYGETARKKLMSRLTWIDGELATRDYLAGDSFTVADAYLFALIGWTQASWITTYIRSDVHVDEFVSLKAWYERVSARKGVQLAIEQEGLSRGKS